MAEERELMREILIESRTIAVVGASDKPDRPAHGVMKFLQGKGYRCIPVNPRLAGQTVLDETGYASLADIPEHIDMVDLFVNSARVGAVVDEAIETGADAVWMQLGVIDTAAADRARKAGLAVIMDRCPAQEWSGLDLPKR
jgi:predicted CoA-binding protein